MLFRVVAFVEEKMLGRALVGLTGVASIVETPQAVMNAKLKGGKLAAETGGSMLEMLAAWIKKQKKKVLVRKDVVAFLTDLGRQPSSSSYVLSEAVKAGLLKKQGKGTKMSYLVREAA